MAASVADAKIEVGVAVDRAIEQAREAEGEVVRDTSTSTISASTDDLGSLDVELLDHLWRGCRTLPCSPG